MMEFTSIEYAERVIGFTGHRSDPETQAKVARARAFLRHVREGLVANANDSVLDQCNEFGCRVCALRPPR